MAGAGWIAGQFRGKFILITAGTNWFSMMRVLDNGVDYLEVAGVWSTPFDNTSVFYLAEEVVTVKPPATYGYPLDLNYNSGGAGIRFYGLKFVIQDYRNASYCSSWYQNLCRISIDYCSLHGNTFPITAGGTIQVLINTGLNPGAITAYATDFWIPPTISGAGVYTGAIWAFGPHGKLSLQCCSFNDAIESYYGCETVELSACSQRYRTNIPEVNITRGVKHFKVYQCYFDAALKTNLWRFDGPVNMDCRDSIWENAPGDGLVTFGHHADMASLYLARTQVNGCGGHGIVAKGNSCVALVTATTDPAKLNTGFGIKVMSGTQIRDGGGNTLRGAAGQINLGDGVMNVNHGTEATDATHLTRVSAL
jgi:hypothetical protein